MKLVPVFFLLSLVTLPFVTIQCANDPAMRSSKPAVEQVRDHYTASLRELDTLMVGMEHALQQQLPTDTLRALFCRARLAYKKAEYLVEYYQPFSARHINGPAIEDIEDDDPTRLLPPEGFQVIEEQLFGEPAEFDRAHTLMLSRRLAALVQRALNTAVRGNITDEHVFDALRLQIARMSSLGLSGFDSPVALHSLPEVSASLHSVRDVLGFYLRDRHNRLYRNVLRHVSQAETFLSYNNNFDSFDRLAFITRFLTPLAHDIQQARTELGVGVSDSRRMFRTSAATLFDTNAFDPLFLTPTYMPVVTDDIVTLGRTLFFDPVLSGNNKRACASCHVPEMAFTDGKAKSLAFDFTGHVSRNAPTLINAAFQSAQFYDQRVLFLEDQANAVVHNAEEMHGSLTTVVADLVKSSEYTTMFTRAFRDDKTPVTERNVRIAIASYIRSLNALNSRFDRYMRGDLSAMNAAERHGFNLFMGRAKCGTCHFMPLFNGTVPPGFVKTELEIIGVPLASDTVNAVLDTDIGRAGANGIDIDRFAFKTPTLRNIALTAPYMHNGVYATLEQVLDFYNRGGGAGLGIPLERQTLPADPLNLTRAEQQAIIAFLHALTDTTGTTTRPLRLPLVPAVAHRTLGGEY